MTVTEFALLRLSTGVGVQDVALRAKLAHAKNVMQAYTRRRFYYFHQIEDPSYIYIIGEWDSLEQHLNHFIPGSENQAVLESLKNDVSVEWLLHINASHADLPLPRTITEREKALCEHSIWSVVRLVIRNDGNNTYQQTQPTSQDCIRDHAIDGKSGGSWRIDKEDNRDELLLLCSCKTVAEDTGAAEIQALEKCSPIQIHINKAELKHLKLLDI